MAASSLRMDFRSSHLLALTLPSFLLYAPCRPGSTLTLEMLSRSALARRFLPGVG